MGYGGFPVRRERPARQNPTHCYAGIRGDLCLGAGSPENRNSATTITGAAELSSKETYQTNPILHNCHRSSSLDGSSQADPHGCTAYELVALTP